MKKLTLICASLLCSPLCLAAGGFSAAPSAQGKQVVFYVSKTLGAHAMRPTVGLRLDEMSALPGMMEAASAALHRRALVNFAVPPQGSARFDFGGQLRWDLRAHSFGSSSER
jgi:hypothetical protein